MSPVLDGSPSRKRKRDAGLPSSAPAVPIQPKPTVAALDNGDEGDSSKRGRKPRATSRAAREARRKLNHSIIEKARRTKINDALSTLRELVPPEYGAQTKRDDRKTVDDDEESSEDDEDEDFSPSKKPSKSRRKQEGNKPKEFKLEILVRTVSYVQDLMARVDELENRIATCECGPVKGKQSDVLTGKDLTHYHNSTMPSPNIESGATSLPSISTWLPNHLTDNYMGQGSHLPTPPSSTQFPTLGPKTASSPPTLSLAPSLGAQDLSPSSDQQRTPDEENAASQLIQMREACHQAKIGFQIQTPGSMLGLGNVHY